MDQVKKLYLIPSDIGHIPDDGIFNKEQREIVFSLKQFIVEKAKTARHFLKESGFPHEMRSVEMLEFNEHNRAESMPEIKQFLQISESIGLMSEAGLPCVADPGHEVVALAHELGYEIVPFYGPSSIMMALMASGFSGQQFVFHGYLPAKTPQKRSALKKLGQRMQREKYTQIFMETPYRSNAMIEDMIAVLPGETKLCVAAEINTPEEFIKTKSLNLWSRSRPDLHKKRCIFLLGS
ncbi:MAG: SAM-dependent methyltransferase [Marinilabiliales bacterium]|nr:MAG: SAM-dependent methyltransferase [Marinilabiliales bacterium]